MIYYIYDPDGDRAKKVSGGATTYYIRGADGSVLAEYDGTGSLTSTYIYTGTQRLATIADDTIQYYIQDHLGNTRVLMADNGTVVSTMEYWPYGTMLSQTGSGDTRFKYTGHERDDESALDYMLARMYEHGTGRFLQMDPLADKYPGISPYVYTAGNPLKYVDPDGQDYVLAINHETKAITVEATFYVQAGDQNAISSAKHALQFWNSKSGLFDYSVGKHQYVINFQLNITEVDRPEVELQREKYGIGLEKNISDGSSNLYRLEGTVLDSKGTIVNGLTSDGSIVRVANSRANTETGAHEIGHSLGVINDEISKRSYKKRHDWY